MNYFIKRSTKQVIEPEEILLDRKSAENLDDSKLEIPIKSRSFFVFLFFIAFVFFVFLGRAFQMQVFEYENYSALAKNNKTRSYPVLSQRGVVYDRNMEQLVFNKPSIDLIAVPANLPKSYSERVSAIKLLAEELSLDQNEILNKIESASPDSIYPIVLKENIKREEALFVEANLNRFSGISLKKNSIRDYKDGKFFSHIIGYTGKVSSAEMKQNRSLSSLDYIGKSGIEFVYDDVLRGENGLVVQYVDSISRLKKEKKVKDEVSGNSIVLSIDSKLQKIIYEKLENQVKKTKTAEGAAAVAMDPNSGEILAFVSIPSYDNNIFSDPNLKSSYKKTISNPLNPLFNRVISGMYSPGSSIKPFVASAALEEKVIAESTKIDDTVGYISIRNKYNPDIVYTFRDWKVGGHGIIDVKEALAVSSNVFFYTIGGGYDKINGLGIEKLKKYLNLFGFGSPTGIDLTGEKQGLIPDPKWKLQNKKEEWYTGDTYISSIGQGNVLVTPLQLTVAMSAIANGGTLFKPYLLKKIIDKDKKVIFENKPKKIRSGFIKKDNIATVKKGLRMAVTEGSARRLADLPIKIAGKTGTAQIGDGKSHAWFVSFAPYNDPQIVLTILVEKGGEGSATAVPVAKEVYKEYFNLNDNNIKN